MKAAVVILIVFFVIFIVSKRNRGHPDISDMYKDKRNKDKKLIRFLYPSALWIIQKIKAVYVDFYDRKDTAYMVDKVSQAMGVVLIGAVISVLYALFLKQPEYINEIIRPSYGEPPSEMAVEINGEQTDIQLQPVMYSYEEVENNFVSAYVYILDAIKGENESLEHVTDNLNLIDYIDCYSMYVSWYCDKPEIVAMNGTVNNRYFDEGMSEAVVLTATLSYSDYSCIYDIDITVEAQKLTKDQVIIRKAESAINRVNKNELTKSVIELPSMIDGEIITYKTRPDNYEWVFILCGVAAGVAVYFGRDGERKAAEAEKKKQMMSDYPEIVSKLTILTGAGMSVRMAWERIVRDYKKSGIKRYAYEEMTVTFNEMNSGVVESIAYSGFGRRCNIHEYLKLGAMLEQNVRSGTKGLALLLENEAWLAFDARKNTALRAGEEAGTKLLLPMMLMLAVVLAIVMIPAALSLGV